MVTEKNYEQEEEENIKPKTRDVGTQWDSDPDGKIQQQASEQRYRRCQRAATEERLEREAAQKARTSGDESD